MTAGQTFVSTLDLAFRAELKRRGWEINLLTSRESEWEGNDWREFWRLRFFGLGFHRHDYIVYPHMTRDVTRIPAMVAEAMNRIKPLPI